MIDNYWIGFIAGLGWGLFLGAPIGVYWLKNFISTLVEDDEEKPSS